MPEIKGVVSLPSSFSTSPSLWINFSAKTLLILPLKCPLCPLLLMTNCLSVLLSHKSLLSFRVGSLDPGLWASHLHFTLLLPPISETFSLQWPHTEENRGASHRAKPKALTKAHVPSGYLSPVTAPEAVPASSLAPDKVSFLSWRFKHRWWLCPRYQHHQNTHSALLISKPAHTFPLTVLSASIYRVDHTLPHTTGCSAHLSSQWLSHYRAWVIYIAFCFS